MSKQTYYYIVSGIFFVVAVIHLVRTLSGWEVVIAGMMVPMWVSFVGICVAGYLAYQGYQFGKRM